MIFALFISFVLMAVPAYLTWRWFRGERYSGNKLVAITCLVILSVASLRLPLYLAAGEWVGSGLIHALISALQTIGLSENLSDVLRSGAAVIDGREYGNLGNISLAATIYCVYAALQYLLSIILCGYSLFNALSRLTVRWELKLRRKPVFFFSQMTEESIHLASSIQDSMEESGKYGVLCFTSVPAEKSDSLTAAWTAAKLRGVYQLRGKLTHALFPLNAASITCVLCHPDENSNLKMLSSLLKAGEEQRNAARRHTKYFVYAQSRHAEQMIEQLTAQYIPEGTQSSNQMICMLNHTENLATGILDQIPLHEYVVRNDAGQGELNILILGSTPLAERFLRNAYSCGQMENCRLSMTLAGPEAEACRERLYADAPMLQHCDMPVVRSCGDLRFCTMTERAAMTDEGLLSNANYILVAHDNDQDNIEVARQIRIMLDRQALAGSQVQDNPVAIVYKVGDAEFNALCREQDAAYACAGVGRCRMFPVGSMQTQNDIHTLLADELLRKGFFLGRIYDGTGAVPKDTEGLRKLRRDYIAFLNTAYQRRSSVAASLHLKYKAHILNDQSLTEQEKLDSLTHVEHMRWLAYMMISGHEAPSEQQLEHYFYRGSASHRCKQLKLHPCVVLSGPTYVPDLWAPDAAPADDLDEVSLRVHALLLKRLREYLPADLLEHPSPCDKARIVAAAEALPPSDSSTIAVRMSKALFTNFKEYDRMISAGTETVIQSACASESIEALRLIWLEVNGSDVST
ncbi:MAG: hypothetical protein IKL25_03220 [Clostridia bacterium]|nr:hypothetical protein [Clostridia bacterium]